MRTGRPDEPARTRGLPAVVFGGRRTKSAHSKGGPCLVAEYSTALAQSPLPLTPVQLPHPQSTFAAQHTPEQVLEAQLAQQCADVAGGLGNSGGGASPVETALAIARMVKQCTDQLRSTPLHLRYALASFSGS